MSHVSALAALGVISVILGADVQVDEKPLRTIAVSGQATVRVVPDRVVISLGVETGAAKLEDAKRDHDGRVKQILGLPAKFQIDAKDVQTDQMRIQILYEWDAPERNRQFRGYAVDQTIAITLKDISKYDALLSAAIEAGANEVSGVDFQTSELRKHRDRARSMAIKAAKEKATDLASALGQGIGRPTNIQEYSTPWWYWSGSSGSGNAVAQVSQQAASPGDQSSDGTIALGQVAVTANVSVTFELVNQEE